ncbi:MAG: ABC transporter ATP-binding protein, partial [Pseudoflavonifractor sp.]
PRILLLDEPLSNLDARLRLEMREEIRRIQQETHITTVFVTHDQEEALSISDEVVLLKGGTVQQIAAPQVLYDEPVNQFAAAFLGAPPICMVSGMAQNGRFIAGDVTIAWDGMNQIEHGRAVALGIRSEALRVSKADETPNFTAAIRSKYVIGRDALAIIELDGQVVRFYLPEELSNLKEGDSIPFTFRNKGVFLFDQETGVRLS